MEICDIINETEEGPRDAIKAIKRRLNQAAGKNYTIVMYTLTVSTCIFGNIYIFTRQCFKIILCNYMKYKIYLFLNFLN